ncbi:TetR/AcrR family transcriptional regulator [Sphingobacterium griseoflavum]|uniref:TetR family transcriptional regulator n=1 Tax=Sphingobacterium griseoflavum TaxID=1474952 RepID=A0ABQ3HY56_9SPHI|nr:TetR/AcrR family transcriptional regulator [Sphingobacterium griseoflavum]GHE39489.1 hypothetical protein GCM10017764_23410 [Sphingobacterium griseoflavum]
MMTEKKKSFKGGIRNKTRSQEKLIDSIGEILGRMSYADLNMGTVRNIANLNPKLIYLYFENFEGLIDAFLRRKETQKANARTLAKHMSAIPEQVLDEDIFSLLETHFDEIMQDPEWKGLLHWGLSAKNSQVSPLVQQHTATLAVVIEILQKNKKLEENMDPVCYALLAAGMTFIAINSRVEGAKLLGLDLNCANTQKRFKEVVEKILIKDS